MQNVVVEEPYVPVLPRHGSFWPSAFSRILPWYLRKTYGVVDFQFEHLERLRASLQAGHGIMLMPNHCRDEDGLVMGRLSCELRQWFYYMGSWHVFKMNRTNAFLLPRLGLYSVNREGVDRTAVKTSVNILAKARRPLVVFPEGFLGRTNDRLNALMDGPALIARTAAKKRAQASPPGQVVIHPVALRYRLGGPLEPGVAGVLKEIEERLGLASGAQRPLLERITVIKEAMLAQKEVEYLGAAQTGPLGARRLALIQAILQPMEIEWDGAQHNDEPVQARVRRLRAVIVPGLTQDGLPPGDREHRWRHLQSIYLAQQLDNYPPDYLSGDPSPERMLETIERFQEDLTDRVQPYVPLRATITIGEAILVDPERIRGAHDPLLGQVEGQLRAMLGIGPA